MQLDDENVPRVTARSKPVESSSSRFAVPNSMARNRSALTDLNNHSNRRQQQQHMSPIIHSHGLNNSNHPSQSQQRPSSFLQSISAPSMASPFFKQTASIPANTTVKPITIKVDPNDQLSQEVVNDENQKLLTNLQEEGEEEEGEENYESVMSVIERTEEEKQDESRRMSLKRQAPADPQDILEDLPIQDTKKPRMDGEEEPQNWDDLDEQDSKDPMMVTEYSDEIFKYYHELEARTLADPNYLYLQHDVRPKMRSILVDWLVEVHMKFRLLPETLFLAINLMDRFLSKEKVQVDRLQLLATGALFIAAKYEEVYSPSIKNYAYITDGAYTENDIREAENYMLKSLNFDISYPSPYNFLRRISKADNYDINARTIGKYLLEISAIDHRFIGYLPSLCTAASMYIARKMVGRNEWDNNLIHYSGGYREQDFAKVCEMIMDYLVSPIIHEEFFKKYASKKYFKVSILARQWSKKVVKEGKSIMDSNL